MSNHQSLADFTFDVAGAAGQAGSIAELEDVIRDGFLALGAQVFVGVEARRTCDGPEVEVCYGATSPEWQRHYELCGHSRAHPILQHLLTSSEPLYWSELEADRPLDRAAQRVMSEARDFGIAEGLVVPLHHPGGSPTAVLLMGDGLDARDLRQRQAASLLCQVFCATARRLRRSTRTSSGLPNLSRREFQAIMSLQNGATNKAIGKTLGLSQHTVADLLASARRKLDVQNRTDLALKVQQLGLIAGGRAVHTS